MWLLKHRIAAVAMALLLAACASGSEGLTVGGARTVFSDPVVVDIVDARFNIPSLLPQVNRVRRTLRDNGWGFRCDGWRLHRVSFFQAHQRLYRLRQ